jgi:outer membrane immunogenic protein
MKKLLLVLCVGASVMSHAQTKFGIHAGAIAANMKETYDGESDVDTKSRISFRAGVHANIPIATNFSIMPQLNYVSKGSRIDQSETIDLFGNTFTYTAKGRIKMDYLELPLHFVYNHPIGNSTSFFIGAGPSFSYGLSGHGKLSVTENNNGTIDQYNEEKEIKFDGKDNATTNDNYAHYKALEIGMAVLAGYQFSQNLFVNAQFNQGLNNINPDKTDNGKTKNSYVGLGIGFYFNR